MTEREVKLLIKLLDKLKCAKDESGNNYCEWCELEVITIVKRLADWYGTDVLKLT